MHTPGGPAPPLAQGTDASLYQVNWRQGLGSSDVSRGDAREAVAMGCARGIRGTRRHTQTRSEGLSAMMAEGWDVGRGRVGRRVVAVNWG